MNNRPLRRSIVERHLAALDTRLSKVLADNLRQLLDLLGDDHRIVLARALAALYPTQSRERALTSFRQLREALRLAVQGSEKEFSLEVDSLKSAPETRKCWFEGQELAEENVIEDLRASADRSAMGKRVDQEAMVGVLADDTRRVVRLFVSYAHEDDDLKKKLIQLLKPHLKIATGYRFELWDDRQIGIGERWKETIREQLAACDFGLLLTSPSFFASDFITQEEIPAFVGATAHAGCLPVGLERFPLDRSADLHGVDSHQIHLSRGRWFGELRGDRSAQVRFVAELREAILQAVAALPVRTIHPESSQSIEQEPGTATLPARHPERERGIWEVGWREEAAESGPIAPPAPPGPSLSLGMTEGDDLDACDEALLATARGFYDNAREAFRPDFDRKRIAQLRAARANFSKSDSEESRVLESRESFDVLDALEAWATNPKPPHYCALLGDYGMGKTTTCQALTSRLLSRRESDASVPLPIYIDLREVGEAVKKSAPTLHEILTEALHKSGGGAPKSRPEEILALVEAGRALLIFDGLDEVLVHLSLADGQQFTRQLWRALPPALLDPTRPEVAPKPASKLLLSCRTHYFRTVREEVTLFTGQDRAGLREESYLPLVLLPFTEEQIRQYLELNLPNQDVERLLVLIRSVHNLPELAERPYTLSLIAKHIPAIEKAKLEGKTVSGVTLYRSMVLSWLERDDGKHTLKPDHKLRLMERFAAELWRSGKSSWSVSDVEEWLGDFMADNPKIARRYVGEKAELLEEDLRTATFLVREGEDQFRFAHTSLQEFFLASHLAQALEEKDFDAWAIAIPSRETLEFLGQLLAEKDEKEREPLLAGLRELRGTYREKASELALAYALRAKAKGYPAQALAGSRLDGADLRGWEIEGTSDALLDLRGASFRGARLRGAKLHRVDVSEVNFEGADLSVGEVIGGRGRKARFGGAKLAGTIFRELALDGASFEGAEFYRSQWLLCGMGGTIGLPEEAPAGLFAGCEGMDRTTALPSRTGEVSLIVFSGHHGSISSSSLSPVDQTLATAGADGTIRLWDMTSGDVLRVLEGHLQGVWSCSYSPDGQMLASAGSDGTLGLWEARSGELLRMFKGHDQGVFACCYSPLGSTLASASRDGLIRVWDVETWSLLYEFKGHQGRVLSCCYSPSGQVLVSVGDDAKVRFWSLESGRALMELSGHKRGIWSCSWSPSGSIVATAGFDATVRLWDVATGETLRVLRGHFKKARECSWSPSGSILASGDDSGTIRLWDIEVGEVIQVLEGHSDWVTSLCWSPTGTTLTSTSRDGSIRQWDISTGEVFPLPGGSPGGALACFWSKEAPTFASAGGDGNVRLWDSETGEMLKMYCGQKEVIFSYSYSPSGSTFARGCEDGRVQLWDFESDEQPRTLGRHQGSVFACSYSPTGSILGTGGADSLVQLWDLERGELFRVLEGHNGNVLTCSWSPSGATVASGDEEGVVRLWNAKSGRLLKRLDVNQHVEIGEDLLLVDSTARDVLTCSWSPTGRLLAVGGVGDGRVSLWDVSSGERAFTLKGHSDWIRDCSWSPSGATFATAGDDGTIRLWDTKTWQCAHVLAGHRGWVRWCGFSFDGRTLASSGVDGCVRFWDIATGREVGWRATNLPRAQAFAYRLSDHQVTYASPEAWRYLGWLLPHPKTGEILRWPAEIFGPLPGVKPPSSVLPHASRGEEA